MPGPLSVIIALFMSLLIWSPLLGQEVNQERPKLALVVANARYLSFDNIPQTYVDAKIVSDVLVAAGFDVVTLRDLNSEKFFSQILDLARRAKNVRTDYVNPLVVLYFSGHGFSREGRQFLVGIDAGRSEDPIIESTALDSIIAEMAGKGIFVAIIDACRTQLRWRTSSRSVESDQVFAVPGWGNNYKGVDPSSTESVESDFLIGYANGYGAPVLASTPDNSANGPYSDGIRRYAARGYRLNSELEAIKDYIRHERRINQSPGLEDNLSGEVYLSFTPQVLREMEEKWSKLIGDPNKDDMWTFLREYRNGPYAGAAKQWLVSNAK